MKSMSGRGQITATENCFLFEFARTLTVSVNFSEKNFKTEIILEKFKTFTTSKPLSFQNLAKRASLKKTVR